ncbi:adenylate/guanylate cyclase domain-containing protein [Leptolyngbya sp. AN02str]|uniref:adenylate/guanylate cyclase domain-containing protein n=1 Tax=Leptolyngbya sp. AN02str TaxID=3423363 RepID=UPI003D315B07
MNKRAFVSHIQKYWQVLYPSLSANDLKRYLAWRQSFMRRRLQIALQIGIVAYATFIMLRLFMGSINPGSLDPSWLRMAIAVWLSLAGCLVLHHSRFGKRHPALVLLGCSWSITLIEQIWATWRGFAFPGIFAWTLVFLAQAALIPVRWPIHLLSQVGVLAYFFGVNSVLGLEQEQAALWDESLWLYLFWFCVICNLSVLMYERLQQAEFQALAELESEREKSERLLLNILPEAVARQLKQEHRTIAENFAEASVLFADIVGFTELSSSSPPEEMVTLLNQIFSTFDYLAERHGLEKIKTIGDSYMVVGGLPTERIDHLEAIADMALDMQWAIAQFSASHSRPFQMRIGINTGPVVAGVIGVKKFIYDLWGDTVNTASRMESHGVAGGIQVTEAVFQRLKHRYRFESRGAIPIKGKGSMVVYLLTGKRDALPRTEPLSLVR